MLQQHGRTAMVSRTVVLCRVVVVSERLALQARELGWQEIQVADSADNDALLRAFTTLNIGSHNDGTTKSIRRG